MDEIVGRLAVALATLALGWGTGLALRRSRRPDVIDATSTMPPGLYVLTAPFCSRCTSLRTHLGALNIPFREVDVRDAPDLARQLGITSAPTLLAVDCTGEITAVESANLTAERVKALATPFG